MSEIKKTPQRTCIACREEKDKGQLLRIVKNSEGEISLDLSSKKNGRGAYICGTRECFLLAKKKNALSRAYSSNIPKQVIEELEEEFFGKN